jgi:putative tryptophan/tyrosine transport system substrate-binding protein
VKVRRPLVLALLGVLIGCFSAESQQAAVPRIGVIALGSPTPGTLQVEAFDSLRQGLRELGYVEGRTIVIESRWDEGRPERNAALARELIRLNVDIIVASTPAATAAAKATKKIPIIMASAGADPVTLGLAASLPRPGGNVTGLTLQNYELSGKRLELLKEALPGVSRVILFWDPAEKAQRTDVKEYQRAARSLGLQLQAVEVSSPEDFDGAFQSAVRASAHAVIMHQGTACATHRATLASTALKSRLPTMSGDTGYAQNGGLMNYGPNIPDSWRRAAGFVDKILKGAKPGDLLRADQVFE